MIVFEQVSKRHGDGKEALAAVTLEIGAGEFTVLSGPSGAGKSSLIRLIPALDRPTTGRVCVGGEDTSRLKHRDLPYWRRRMGLILQEPSLLPDRSVLDHVLMPLDIAGFGRKEADRRARAALDQVGLLDRERALPPALSGGEQQRLLIARALVHRPALLLADEPTAHLDAGQAADIAALFADFHRLGVTILLATHDVDIFSPYQTRQIALQQGRVLP